MENSSCLTQRCAQAPSISMCIWLFFLPLKFPEHPLILWGRWEAGGPGGICPQVWPWFYHAEMGNEGGKAQLRQSLCSLPSFGKKKEQKNESSQKYRSEWKKTTQEGFQTASEKMKINSYATAFWLCSQETWYWWPKICMLSWVDVKPSDKEGKTLPKIFSSQFFQPKHSHYSSIDSDISQWVASLPLVPMFQETKLICLSRGAQALRCQQGSYQCH